MKPMFDKSEVCGTCKWCKYWQQDDDWYCDNEESEYYTDWMAYGDKCEEWEERE